MPKKPNNNLEKDLKQLANMLKKNGKPSFQNQLRQQILNKADTMNTQKKPAKSDRTPFSFTSIFKFGLIPVTALAVILLFTFNIFVPKNILPVEFVNVAEARDYYTITPTAESQSGVDAETEFLLKSKGSLNLQQVEQNLIVEPATEVELSQRGDNEIVISPVNALDKGEVYSITLEAQNLEESPYKKEYGWAFQVSDELSITGTIPGSHQTDIPYNTGIEINFNTYGITTEEFQNNFTIEPQVEGEFSMNGKTAIFAPSELEAETIYTVTISENLAIPGTEKTLGKPYTFQFETSGSSAYLNPLRFDKQVYEFEPTIAPSLTVYTNSFEGGPALTSVSGSVYRFENSESFEEAFDSKYLSRPFWSGTAAKNIDTEGMTEVYGFEDLPIEEYLYDNYIHLPETLSQGFYIVEVRSDDVTAQALIQISTTAAFLNISDQHSFIWLHDAQTSQPIQGANIERVGTEGNATTDENGFTELDSLNLQFYDSNNPESEDGQNLIKVTRSDGQITYYGSQNWNTYIENNWNYFQTDRSTYHPTDTIHYWSFLQGKNEPINGKATLILQPQYIFFDYTTATSEQIYYEQEVELKDGEIISGSIDIEKLPSQNYELALIQNNERVSSTSFYVTPFIKPEYQITVTPERNAIFANESTSLAIESTFFEGTPVPNLALQYGETTYGTQRLPLTTNAAGEATGNYQDQTAPCGVDNYCSLFKYVYISASPVREELADITGSATIQVARSSIGASSIEIDRDSIAMQLQHVDLAKASEVPYAGAYEDIWAGPAPQGRVTVTIEEIINERVEEGQTYDPLTKTVQPAYRYETRYELISKEDPAVNENGTIEYNPELEEGKNYRVNFAIFDEQNRYYTESHYIGRSYNYGEDIIQLLGIDENDNKFVPGEQISLSVADEAGNPFPNDRSQQFIYSIAQNTVEENILSSEPNFDYTFTEEDIPSIGIKVFSYDGQRYRSSYPQTFRFDAETRRLNIEAETNQDSYEPGEEVTLDIQVTEQSSGNPAANAYANIYLVDEAYYSLFAEEFSDPLNSIYGGTYQNFGRSYESLNESVIAGEGGLGGCFIAGTQILMANGNTKSIQDIQAGDRILTRENERNGHLVSGKVARTYEHDINEYLLINGHLGVTKEHIIFLNGQWQLAEKAKLGDTLINTDGEPVVVNSIETIREPIKVYNFEVEEYHTYFADGLYVHNQKGGTRDVFKDTAVFEVVRTDGAGQAQITFDLPDNITSWRASVAAIKGGTILAGHDSIQIPVTKPVFAVPVINPQYLLGDEPQIPMRGYGTSLTQENEVNFTLKVPSLNFEESTIGKAFLPSYITLPQLTLGEHRIEVTAETQNSTDTIALNTNVLSTHVKETKTWGGIVENGMKLPGGAESRTQITFSNNEVGPIYGSLLEAQYGTVGRADIAAAEQVAKKLLNEHFQEENFIAEFEYSSYQDPLTGGISIIPYGDPDLNLTALLAGLDATLWEQRSIQNYLTTIVDSKNETLTRKLQAIYGLAAIGTPRLTELDYFTQNFNLTTEDHIYAALAYLEFGAQDKATNHFLEIMKASTSQNQDQYEDTLRVTAETPDMELKLTALTATIASAIGDESHKQLWNSILYYGWDHTETLILEKMLYAQTRLAANVQTEVSFSVNGQNITLSGNEIHTLSVTPEELNTLNISNINGEVYAVTFYEEDLDLSQTQQTQGININRRYIVDGRETTTLEPGETVEVHFNVTVPGNFEGGYEIKEYLPSGMLPITHSQRGKYEEQETSYYHPYHQNGQEIRFHVYCSTDYPCQNKNFYYLARVINKGIFVQEPAIIQKYDNPAIMGFSSSEKSSIEIQ